MPSSNGIRGGMELDKIQDTDPKSLFGKHGGMPAESILSSCRSSDHLRGIKDSSAVPAAMVAFTSLTESLKTNRGLLSPGFMSHSAVIECHFIAAIMRHWL